MFAQDVTRQLPILLFLSFDGFRHDYVDPKTAPNLYDISQHATMGHMESMFITKTFPNHFSMVTGLYEDEHEIINNKMYDPILNETFKPGVGSPDWWNPKGRVIPIWTANQVYGDKSGANPRYSGSMMYPGAMTPYEGVKPFHLHDFDLKRNWTKNIDTVLEWLTDPEQPANFVALYFDEPDSVAHSFGPWGKETLQAVRRVDSAAGYLVKRLRELDLAHRTNVLFVSDHGMAEVKGIIYLSDFIDTHTFEMYGNTPDWSLFVKPEFRHMRNKIFQGLMSASRKNHYRIYKRSDIPPEMHYSKTPRVGDFFILVDEGYDLFMKRPNKSWVVPEVWGNHGWAPSTPDMRPLFMAYGPSFREGYYHSEPFPNIDLYPLMTFLLDLPSESLPNNGSLARVVDIIDPSHFDHRESWDNIFRVVGLVLFGLSALLLSGTLFMFVISSIRPKRRPKADFDELGPGLKIDLGFYVSNQPSRDNDLARKRNEELLSLLYSK